MRLVHSNSSFPLLYICSSFPQTAPHIISVCLFAAVWTYLSEVSVSGLKLSFLLPGSVWKGQVEDTDAPASYFIPSFSLSEQSALPGVVSLCSFSSTCRSSDGPLRHICVISLQLIPKRFDMRKPSAERGFSRVMSHSGNLRTDWLMKSLTQPQKLLESRQLFPQDLFCHAFIISFRTSDGKFRLFSFVPRN